MSRKNKGKRTRRNSNRDRAYWPWALLLVCLAMLSLGVYTLYLDHEIRTRFQSARWALPAHVYAAPTELYTGAPLKRAQLLATLGRLGYRKTAHPDQSGEYRVSERRVSLISRPFRFWDGARDAQHLAVTFSRGRIASLSDARSGKAVPLARLDPLMIGSIYPGRGQDRTLVRLQEVPPLLVNTLIAVEDHRFRRHHGLDVQAIGRALVADIRAGRIVQGGSTLTQQLVKNLFLNNSRTIWRKFNEAIMALLLEIHYRKPAILQAYLNEVYLGQDGGRAIRGFGLASYFYFRRPVAELQPGQIAMLVALVKGPTYYDPRRHPKRARQRRNTVLQVMRQRGLVSRAQAGKARRHALDVVANSSRSATRYPDFIGLVRRQLASHYKRSALTTEGLRIFTTLKPRVQEIAQRDVTRQLARIEKSHRIARGTLQAAAVIAAPESGQVIALVGGRRAGYAGFNRALNGKRQIGSLIKPAVYLTALKQASRYTLVTPLEDAPIRVKLADGKVWEPRNYERRFHGRVPLYEALAHSYNAATVHLGMQVGVSNVIATLRELGLRQSPQTLPSLLLGALNLTPLQVTQMYSTIASGGFHKPLLAIRSVTTSDGRPLRHYPMALNQVEPPAPTYLLQWAMQQVMRQGTGRSAYRTLASGLNLAGKTGTTDNTRDSWFAGFDQQHLIVAWVGRDDSHGTGLAGASGGLRVWSAILHDMGPDSLLAAPPSGVESMPVVLPSGLRADRHCGNAISVPFVDGSAPQRRAPCAHQRTRHHDHGALDWLKRLF